MKKQTKKDRLESAREIIDRNAIDVPFPYDDVECFSVVCDRDIDGAVRRVNPQFPNSDPRHLHTLIGGIWEARSWRKWINPLTPEQEAKLIMRHVVYSDMRGFRLSQEPQECAACGAVDDLTTDHFAPPFDEIASGFILENGLPEIVGPSEKTKVVSEFANFAVKAKWIAYHAALATYQILCRSCNSSKGKK